MLEHNAKSSIDRILEYALELQWRDYRGELARWNVEYQELMNRKPREPKENNSGT